MLRKIVLEIPEKYLSVVKKKRNSESIFVATGTLRTLNSTCLNYRYSGNYCSNIFSRIGELNTNIDVHSA